jgi:hypothetical protein
MHRRSLSQKSSKMKFKRDISRLPMGVMNVIQFDNAAHIDDMQNLG